MGTPPTIDNIIHSQGSFSDILYKSYIVTHAITRSIAFELCLGRTISSMLKLNKGGVAIRMSWYAFFEKKIVGGGTSIPDWRVFRKSQRVETLKRIVGAPRQPYKNTRRQYKIQGHHIKFTRGMLWAHLLYFPNWFISGVLS